MKFRIQREKSIWDGGLGPWKGTVGMNGVYSKMKMEKVNTTVALLEAILGDVTLIFQTQMIYN